MINDMCKVPVIRLLEVLMINEELRGLLINFELALYRRVIDVTLCRRSVSPASSRESLVRRA